MKQEARPIEALWEARDCHTERQPPHEEQRGKAPLQRHGTDSEAKKLLLHDNEENTWPPIESMHRRGPPYELAMHSVSTLGFKHCDTDRGK